MKYFGKLSPIVKSNATAVIFFIVIAIILSAVSNFFYQKYYVSPRYWDNTVMRSNQRVADLTVNILELYGAERFSELTSAELRDKFSNLGYNLNIYIIKDSIVAAKTKYAKKDYNGQEIRNSIPCSVNIPQENCRIIVTEDVHADARNINLTYTTWLKNWFTDVGKNFSDKYNNITMPFLYILFVIILVSYLFKQKVSFEKKQFEHERDLLLKQHQKLKDEYSEYAEMASDESHDVLFRIHDLERRIQESRSVKENEILSKDMNTEVSDGQASKIRSIFRGVFENIEFTKEFSKEVQIKHGDSITRKLVKILYSLNTDKKIPYSNTTKTWKGAVPKGCKSGYGVFEIDIGSKERLFVQEIEGKPWVCFVDYKHKTSEGR